MHNPIKDVYALARWRVGAFKFNSQTRKSANSPTRQPANAPTYLAFLLPFALMLAGCSTNYNGERLFWKAEQLNAPIVKDPTHATPEQFTKAVAAFNRVIQKTPGTVWAARAQMSVGNIFALQKQYNDARQAFSLVLQNYNDFPQLCLIARAWIAKSFEIEKNWPAALKAYSEVASYHPWTQAGLEVPLYIASVYSRQGKPEEAKAQYERAVRQYTDLIPQSPSDEIKLHVKWFLAQAHLRLGDWGEAAALMEELLPLTTDKVNRPLMLSVLGSIYQTKLNQPERAKVILAQFISEFPDHPLVKAANARLERLDSPAANTVETPSQSNANPTPVQVPLITPATNP